MLVIKNVCGIIENGFFKSNQPFFAKIAGDTTYIFSQKEKGFFNAFLVDKRVEVVTGVEVENPYCQVGVSDIMEEIHISCGSCVQILDKIDYPKFGLAIFDNSSVTVTEVSAKLIAIKTEKSSLKAEKLNATSLHIGAEEKSFINIEEIVSPSVVIRSSSESVIMTKKGECENLSIFRDSDSTVSDYAITFNVKEERVESI